MRLANLTILLTVVLVAAQGQNQRKASTYLFGQYSRTLYDYTKSNNQASYGVALQMFFKTKTPFSPTIELASELIYLDDKVFRINANGSEVPTITGMVTLFGGTAFHINPNIYASLVSGPAYVSDRLLPGIKPSLGFYFDKNQRFTGKISYTNIFNRYKPTGEDYGTINLALGFKLF